MRCEVLWGMLVLWACWPSAASAGDPPSPARLAASIDARLEAEWKRAGVEPAPIVDDATFLRRASLDLIGRIPTVAETREFYLDSSPDKQTKLVARLIESGGHPRHMAAFWRHTWLPQADTAEFARLADEFEAWVAACIQENVRYDAVVRELLTANKPAGRNRSVSPVGFFMASEDKPENLAANATRAFLGVNLDCAQCHNHPFARWTQDQFWQTAAFFAPPKKDQAGKMLAPVILVPNTTRSMGAQLLDGADAKWPEPIGADSGRHLLADWLTARQNPYFARNAVNRLWAHMYGTALVEPLDDLSSDSSGTGCHAELLSELADAFVESGFDLKYITQALVLTKAYRLSAVSSDSTDLRQFARMPVRGLTGEQLYDSLRTAAGLPPDRVESDRGQGLAARRNFAAQFHVARPVNAERSITQALSMMNGRLTNELSDPAKNPTLAGVIDAPFLDANAKIETLFLAVLGRKPSASEGKVLLEHVERASSAQRDRALGDVFWAIINSTEFNTSH